ncbi:APC family permease [Natronobacterium gregoryi]|uniref:APC family permease n=2 Tax=Natronobacterium gregoryi TaxID=44930 RepID=L0AM93_NATGS|nr:APC family permease [Natronobacterium gregoryi]AFZ74150.1 amino acid transporter [Natronobacterium gregoryi SP2]ELY63605.1 amino acid permease-associated protein [Natronobacterium gregoryi SP2]PLK22057.1 APC family permease [Natronobacterium gregoryi SP2]
MPTGLKRDLGLFSTSAIAIGAMIGSGIFILPGVAYVEVGGPAVVAAFLIAGVLVLPAAFSASEMATAMPEDGGSYVYVERGMGPLLGTVAGVGNWFMLSFKSALALVGGVPYLVYVAPELAAWILPLALGLAVFFTLLNATSTESTGRLQFGIVAIMIVVMAWFVVGGIPDISAERTAGAFDATSDGFLAATALVFISYAGVIKIASVAEEVEDPGTTIPRAMLGSLLVTTVLYVLVVYVAIGLVDVEAAIEAGQLDPDGEGPIMALAADSALGTVGVVAVVAAALMALASTANAGLMAAARFPFAMARDNLAPDQFEAISDRFRTPVAAIVVTGVAISVMILTLPLDLVAKFGSGFGIIVFVLVNISLVGFREGAVDDYDPTFTSPLYPWMQLAGIAGGLLVFSQMGLVPIVGSLVIVALSLVWYAIYARSRIDREGAARSGVRQSVTERALEQTADLFDEDRRYDTLVALTDDTSERARTDMVRMGADLSRLRTGSVAVAKFTGVPHRAFTGGGLTVSRPGVPDWLSYDEPPGWVAETDWSLTTAGATALRDPASATFDYLEITAENVPEAVVEFSTFEGYDLLVLERRPEELHRRFSSRLTDHVLKNAPCGVLLVEDYGFDGADEIAVVANRGPYDPLKLLVADAIAEETGAELVLLQAVPADAPEQRRETVHDYHVELMRILTVPARSRVVETDDRVAGLARFAESADLLVTGMESRGLRGDLFGRPGDRLVDSVDVTAVMVQPDDERQPGLVQRVVLDKLFGG